MRPVRGVRLAYWSRTDVLISVSRSDPSGFFLARFHLGLHKDTFTWTRLLGETFDFWKHEENACAPSFLDQVHVNVTFLDDHDVAVCAGSLKSSNAAAVTLSPTTAPAPAPPVTAQGDIHVNTITGKPWISRPVCAHLVLLLFDITGLVSLKFFCRCCRGFCSRGIWLTSSLERV